MARKKPKWQMRVARTGGVLVLALGLLYWWLPWEYDFFPKPPPNPNPLVDPDSARLFKKGTRVMLVTAHPDDAEFYLGGTLPQLHASGADLALVVCTDGDKSYYGPFTNAAENRKVRRKEATEAARQWGCHDVTFLGYPDGRLTDGADVQADVAKQIERFKPEYVFSFDDDYPPRRTHQDHHRAGEVTVRAAKAATNRPDWLLLYSTSVPNHAFDVDKTWPEKERLMQVHASQFVADRNNIGDKIFGRGGDPWPTIQGIVFESATEAGEPFGLSLAEPVRIVRLNGQ
ncbi:hypothetical protein BH11ARM2_BH11ARM2_31590 [soil metagenome]